MKKMKISENFHYNVMQQSRASQVTPPPHTKPMEAFAILLIRD